MAINISGTTVINNSRQLQNIASLDSTTISTISSAGIRGLSEPDFDNAIYFKIRNSAGSTTSTAATNVSYASNYVTITGAGSGTAVWFTAQSLAAGYERGFYSLFNGGGYIVYLIDPQNLINTTTEKSWGNAPAATNIVKGFQFFALIDSGNTLRLRFSLFNAVQCAGWKVDL